MFCAQYYKYTDFFLTIAVMFKFKWYTFMTANTGAWQFVLRVPISRKVSMPSNTCHLGLISNCEKGSIHRDGYQEQSGDNWKVDQKECQE